MRYCPIALLVLFFLAAIPAARAGCIYEDELTGKNLQVGTLLTWSTISEENNRHFLIEKSEDGQKFITVGTVEAMGDSDDLQQYNFLDVMANQSVTYYRLRQVDTDGT